MHSQQHFRLAALSAAVISCIPFAASAQLEEIVVTATRRETNLQSTPVSIQAFSAEQLELGGITNGRDLGIMVPNVVLNPGTGGGQSNFYIRGLPGVGLYVDGVWQDGFGFQQTNFLEMERIEVLRGPQGTLFGRNTNGGAVNMTTKPPADEFGARVKLDVGDFNRRDASVAIDLPLTDTFKTKFTAASYKNDGFLEGLTVPWDFGSQDDAILRADLLWEPTDTFSLRFTHNDESKRGTDPKIHQMTRYNNSKVLAYNIMMGAFQTQANASQQAINGTNWPTPPTTTGKVGGRFTGTPLTAFNPTTHTTNWQGGALDFGGGFQTFGPGTVGKFQTRSDSAEDGITADLTYTTLTAKWGITDNLDFEAIWSDWNQDQRQVVDFDGTELIITTDDINQKRENQTIELHLSGSALDDRINWIAGYYNLKEDLRQRFYRWGMWEFAIPNTGPARPAGNVAYTEYVRQTAILLNLEGISGGKLQTTSGNLYPWNFSFISDDALTQAYNSDKALFGEATFGVTDKLDLTVGARISEKTGGDRRFAPASAFRTPDPDIRPNGDMYAYSATTINRVDAKQPKINTYKFAAQYQATDDLMLYTSYGEGFTSASEPIVTIGPTALVPDDCSVATRPGTLDRIPGNGAQVICSYLPEIIETVELGLRSDFLDGSLRFNATYFDSKWGNMRVTLLPFDAAGNTQPNPYQSGKGAGTATGFEFEVVYAPTDRLQLNLGLGLIDTNYQQAGAFTGSVGVSGGLVSAVGNYPGAPFAYAAETSGTLGVQYDIPMSSGGHIMLIGNYGYMGEYSRDAAYQRTEINADGTPKLEPGYGILNSRFVYEPADRRYSLELWGKNLTNELYVNGGFDTRDTWGYSFSIIGRSREVGVSLGFTF